MLSMEFKPLLSKVGKAISDASKGWKLQENLTKFAFVIEAESKKVSPVDTGRMRASIYTTVQPLMAQIKPNVHYAGYVHWGTRKMKARPFMQWGLQSAFQKMPFDQRSEFVVDIEGAFEKEFKKAGA